MTDDGGARRAVTARARPFRVFAGPADEPRSRRASDVVALIGAVLALAAISASAAPTPGFARAVARLLTTVPGFFDGVWQLLADLPLVLAVLLLLGVILQRRAALARDLVTVAVVAAVGWVGLHRWVLGAWPDVADALRAATPPPEYPSPRIAVTAAVVMTASPHLTKPMRRLGYWVVGLAALAEVALGGTTPLGTIAGLLLALAAASLVHLVFGSSGGRPSLELIHTALAELGVEARTLTVGDEQVAGLFSVDAVDADGHPLVVKVYGRDAHDSALLSTMWRTVWYREPGSPLRLGRLQQVEHEAFLTLFARQAGIATDTVVTAGATEDDDALLVLSRSGALARERSATEDDASLLPRIWELVDTLGQHGIAHGQIDDSHLLIDGEDVGVVGFRGATVAASETQRRTDEVQAFVTTVTMAGPERALDAAVDGLGEERLAAALAYLQPPALTDRQRELVGEQDIDLDRLRKDAAERVGAEPPELQELRRVSPKSIVSVVLPAVALIALISGLAGLDFEELLDQLRDAKWWLVALAFITSQLPRLTQALSTLGASPVPLPLGPVYALQLAASYINLAVPSSAGRIALNLRFFQRHGVPPGRALAAGALDGVAGFIAQASLFGGLLLLTSRSVDLEVDEAVDTASSILLVVVIIVLIAVLVVVSVGKLRRFVGEWGRRIWVEAREALQGLRSPRRVALLLGGNFATEILFASALGLFVRALGHPIGIDELLLINISIAMLSGLLPIPGGIGVAEGGLTWGLVQAGVPEELAFASVLLYRFATFYLPPIWGYFAVRWLERRNHL